MGGIIGTNIVRYDIYGRDVLIANKMESNGKAGNVMISETTKNILMREQKQEWNFVYETEVEVKNMNTSIKGYLVEEMEYSN